MKKLKILIAPWGDPRGWKEVEYIYRNSSIKSSTSLKILMCKIKPDRTLVIGLDTVVDNLLKSFNPKIYNDIEKLARNYYMNYIRKWSLCLEEEDIIVAFGKGEFSNSKFEGNALDFYNKVIYELSTRILEVIDRETNEIEIYLDISHGINFMPVLTYRIVRQIAQILAYFSTVRFVVLNSDPYIGGVESLTINEISNIKIRPQFYVYKKRNRPLESYESLDNEGKKEIGKKLNTKECIKINDELYSFASAVMYGIPYYVYLYFPDTSAVYAMLKCVLDLHYQFIELSKSSKLLITRKVQFEKEFAELVRIRFISKLMEIRGNIKQKREVKLSEIKHIKDFLWDKFPIEKNRIDKEIDDINKLQNIPQSYQVYASILGKSIGNSIDKRNFFAHAGFEHNSIELKKQGNDIFIRVNSKLEDQARGHLLNALPKGG